MYVFQKMILPRIEQDVTKMLSDNKNLALEPEEQELPFGLDPCSERKDL